MRLNRTTRNACGLMGAMAIMSIIYYALMIPPLLRRPKPQPEYYGQALGSLPTQWGRRSATVCGPEGCSPASPDDGVESWTIYSDAWVCTLGGQEVGRIYRDGRISGFAAHSPTWYPSEMPQRFQTVGKVGSGSPVVGQSPPTGVNKDKLEEHKKNVPGGFTMNGVSITEAEWRANLSRGAKMTGFKDYDALVRVSVIGPEDACKAYRKVVDDLPKPVRDKLLFDTYDPKLPEDEHHIAAHLKGAEPVLKDLKPGKAIAYVQFSDGTTPAVATEPDELRQAVGQLRDENGKFDVSKARVGFKTTDEVMGISLLLLLLGVPLLIWANSGSGGGAVLSSYDVSSPLHPLNPANPLNPLNPLSPVSPMHDSLFGSSSFSAE